MGTAKAEIVLKLLKNYVITFAKPHSCQAELDPHVMQSLSGAGDLNHISYGLRNRTKETCLHQLGSYEYNRS